MEYNPINVVEHPATAGTWAFIFAIDGVSFNQ